MKTHLLIISEVLSFFRNWLHRKETYPPQAELPAASTPEEVLHLCCNLVRKTEKQVRLQVKRLQPDSIRKVYEPDTSLRWYKGLQIESREYALWAEFYNPNGKPRNEKTFLHCQTVLLFFQDTGKLNAFLHALKDEEQFQCFWDHCWLYAGEEPVKVTLEMARTPELSHCLVFGRWNHR